MRFGRLVAVFVLTLLFGHSLIASAATAPPRLTISFGPTAEQYAVMGTQDVFFFDMKFETNEKPITPRQVSFTLNMENNIRNLGSSLGAFSLWNGDTWLANMDHSIVVLPTGRWIFTFPLPVGNPNTTAFLNQPLNLTLKGLVVPNGTPGSDYWFSIAESTDVEAVVVNPPRQGARTEWAEVVLSGATSKKISVYQTRVELTSFMLGSENGRLPNSFDTIGGLTFTADSAGDAMIREFTLRFSGARKPFIVTVAENFGEVGMPRKEIVRLPGSTMRTACVPDAFGSCMVTFRPDAFSVSAGDSRSLLIQVNSGGFAHRTVTMHLDRAMSLIWSDGNVYSIPAEDWMAPATLGVWTYN